jgi:hypothetical protein
VTVEKFCPRGLRPGQKDEVLLQIHQHVPLTQQVRSPTVEHLLNRRANRGVKVSDDHSRLNVLVQQPQLAQQPDIVFCSLALHQGDSQNDVLALT